MVAPQKRKRDTSICPVCGAVRITTAAVPCWLCCAVLPPLTGPLKVPRDRSADHSYLGVLLGAVMLMAVIGTFLMAPGLGIIFIIWSVPILLGLWNRGQGGFLSVVVTFLTIIAAGVEG